MFIKKEPFARALFLSGHHSGKDPLRSSLFLISTDLRSCKGDVRRGSVYNTQTMEEVRKQPGTILKNDRMLFRFSLYGFLKNLRFFEPFLLLTFRDAGLSFFQIGLLYSIRDLSTNLLEIPAGFLADIYGRRRAMVMSFSAYIVSFLVFFLLPGFASYAGAMVIFAMGEALRSGTHKALILEHLKLEGIESIKVAYYGRTRGASQLGSALNALIAAGLVFYTGDYRFIFVASVLPYILDLINLATYPPELDGELGRRGEGRFRDQVKQTFGDFVGIFKHRFAVCAILNSAGYSAAFKSVKDYLQPLLEAFALSLPLFLALEETRRSALVIGAVYFIIYLLTSFASRSAARFSDRFANLARAVNLSFLAGAVMVILAGVASWLGAELAAIALFLGLFLLQNVRRPMNVGIISDQIDVRVMASGLSVESQATTLLMSLFAPIIGALADRFSIGVALMVFGLCLAALTWFVRVQPAERGVENPSGG